MTASKEFGRRLRATCAVGALVCAALPTTSRADDERVTLDATAHVFATEHIRAFGPTDARAAFEDDDEYFASASVVALGPALERLLEADIAVAGGSLDAGYEECEVTGGPEVVELARRRIAALRDAVEGTATLRIALVHLPDAADAAHARDASAVRAAVGAGRARVLLTERIVAQRGEPVALDDVALREFVADLDVEVAEYASIGDPVTGRIATGTRLRVLQRPLDGTRTVVALACQLTRLDGVRAVRTGAGALEIPDTTFGSVASTFLATRGTTSVVVLRHPWESGVVAVLVDVLALPATDGLGARLVDTVVLCGGSLAEPTRRLGLHDVVIDDAEGEECDPFAAARALAKSIETSEGGIELCETLALVTDAARVFGEPREHRLVRRVVPLEASELASLPGWDPLDASLPAANAATLAARASAFLVDVPLVEHGAFFASAGRTTRVVTDVDVEIATGASLTDPIVLDLVTGASCAVQFTGGAASIVPVATWRTVRSTAETEPTPIAVVRELEGKRVDSEPDHIDAAERRERQGSLVLTGGGRIDVRSAGDAAEADSWSFE